MTDTTPVVFIVDDDDAVRDSLGLLLRSAGMNTQGYPSAETFLEDFDDNMVGCLVLDIRMPGMNGLELQANLAQRHSTLPVVFITAHGDIPMAVEAVRMGASDFVQKPFDDTEIVSKVSAAMEDGQRHHEEEAMRHVVLERLTTLTARERHVMDEVITGKANKVIAADLGISQRTVEIHRARVMAKMKVTSLAQLVRAVLVAEASI
jgi:two-component system response regulator FixJ